MIPHVFGSKGSEGKYRAMDAFVDCASARIARQPKEYATLAARMAPCDTVHKLPKTFLCANYSDVFVSFSSSRSRSPSRPPSVGVSYESPTSLPWVPPWSRTAHPAEHSPRASHPTLLQPISACRRPTMVPPAAVDDNVVTLLRHALVSECTTR